jgi:hypothetical protein
MRGNSLQKKPDPRPITVEATLLWRLPDRVVAMDAKGYFYTWVIKNPKTNTFKAEEGDMVFVHADELTRDVFYITPKNDRQPDGAVSAGDS